MHAERHRIELTTDGDGNAVGYTGNVTGRVLEIVYTKAAGDAAFANGVDFTVTGETTGVAIYAENSVDASKSVFPRRQVHSQAGVALTLEGTEPLVEPVWVANERVKVAVAQGGTAGKTGIVDVLIG